MSESNNPTVLSNIDRLSLECLMNRTKYSRFVSSQGKDFSVDREYKTKLNKYNSYIQAKLQKLRKSDTPDTNVGIQKNFDALMRLIIADIDTRLERFSQREDNSLFDDVDDIDDDYIVEVTEHMEERNAIMDAETIRVTKMN